MIDWTVLDSVGRRVRVNHALEHATITILSHRVGNVVLRGRSNRKGFYITGDVSSETIGAAAGEALERLRSGQSELAIHPFCGTNLAVSGLLAGVSAATAARLGRRSGTYPSAVLGALLALLVAQPVGFWVQRHLTTQSDVRDLRVVDVERKFILGKSLHFVLTAQ
jgi:Domain of unknown function (DUF6391)